MLILSFFLKKTILDDIKKAREFEDMATMDSEIEIESETEDKRTRRKRKNLAFFEQDLSDFEEHSRTK